MSKDWDALMSHRESRAANVLKGGDARPAMFAACRRLDELEDSLEGYRRLVMSLNEKLDVCERGKEQAIEFVGLAMGAVDEALSDEEQTAFALKVAVPFAAFLAHQNA